MNMKMLSSLEDIPELKNDSVHIKNEKELLDKLNKIIQDGHSNLQIVTDFDHTLTRHSMDNGNTVLTSFGMFRECPSIPEYYKVEDCRLADVYRPIECDPVMSTEDKIKHMIDWYTAARTLLVGIKFPRRELTEAAEKMRECFRKGVSDMISWCERNQVPVLVFSAGLGESVVAALEAAQYIRPNVKVVSNFLQIDSEDNIVGIQGEIIHTYNKNEAAIKDTEYYAMVRQRSNVILMGDNIGDAGMAEGMAHCAVVVRVGYLARPAAACLARYRDTFDVVLLHDSTLDVVNALLRRLA